MADIIDGKPVEEINPEEENLVFHYERGSFRNREDQRTKDFATGKIKMSPGFFKALVSTKGNKIVFFTMLICIGVVVFLGIFRRPETDVVSGIRCEITAFSFAGEVYASLEMENASNKNDNVPVVLEVLLECINYEGAVADKYSENCSYGDSGKQYVRAVFKDYDLKQIRASIRCGENEKILMARIKQR
ncbi:hypothetical protein [Treponema sp.]|uniref:hypothetical protein n=1 Tax=Treponema sp. TaxID=166 RepID=UPI00389016B3